MLDICHTDFDSKVLTALLAAVVETGINWRGVLNGTAAASREDAETEIDLTNGVPDGVMQV